MTNSSQTVQVLVTQVALMREELDQTRNLMTELLKEMLRIAQTQADTTRELTAAFTTMVQSTQITGPGDSRIPSDDADYRAWRDELHNRNSGLAR